MLDWIKVVLSLLFLLFVVGLVLWFGIVAIGIAIVLLPIILFFSRKQLHYMVYSNQQSMHEADEGTVVEGEYTEVQEHFPDSSHKK